jgi:hypothetical protein
VAGAGSTIKVSGHNAYLPAAVHALLRGEQGLNVAQSQLTASSTVTATGDVTTTESAPLMRCSGSDLFPPTPTSCPTLVSAGVKFTRVSAAVRGAHQVKVRDTYTSTDSASHVLALEYHNSFPQPQSGSPGYTFPGHSTTFARSTADQVVTGFGTGAASVFVRSDLYASADDPWTDTNALTWSKAPSSIKFSHYFVADFDMSYSLSVPAAGTAFLGFAQSQNLATTGAKSLATLAVGDMMAAPSITSPANGATLPTTTTTVNGKLAAGANGLPTSVGVNGHAATITKTSATTATYHVVFTEAAGKHAITATAHDVAGNVKSVSITVTNK